VCFRTFRFVSRSVVFCVDGLCVAENVLGIFRVTRHVWVKVKVHLNIGLLGMQSVSSLIFSKFSLVEKSTYWPSHLRDRRSTNS